uniref:Uncharacterized protein n=1 Tax=Acrobeloides nanus TaxID=290746 RepID=A0A914CEJ9_9BILA
MKRLWETLAMICCNVQHCQNNAQQGHQKLDPSRTPTRTPNGADGKAAGTNTSRQRPHSIPRRRETDYSDQEVPLRSISFDNIHQSKDKTSNFEDNSMSSSQSESSCTSNDSAIGILNDKD